MMSYTGVETVGWLFYTGVETVGWLTDWDEVCVK